MNFADNSRNVDEIFFTEWYVSLATNFSILVLLQIMIRSRLPWRSLLSPNASNLQYDCVQSSNCPPSACVQCHWLTDMLIVSCSFLCQTVCWCRDLVDVLLHYNEDVIVNWVKVRTVGLPLIREKPDVSWLDCLSGMIFWNTILLGDKHSLWFPDICVVTGNSFCINRRSW